MLMVGIMAVGMATMNLVIKESILAVVSYNNKSPNFSPMHWRKLEAETLAPLVLEPNILENHETKVAVMDLEITGNKAGTKGFTYCQEANFSRR
jgi:hypothetical protein